jgi:hypothetical protein
VDVVKVLVLNFLEKLMLNVIKWSFHYAMITLVHKWYVLIAGIKLKVPIYQLLVHDLSKFYLSELPQYGIHFCGDNYDKDGFRKTWIHHQNLNRHHWEWWMDRSRIEVASIPMPEKYIREMIADWMGASRAYSGKSDISDWLNKSWNRKLIYNLHIDTLVKVKEILFELGYGFEEYTGKIYYGRED